jgi:hypothetical protein
MQPVLATNRPTQARLRRFIRQPERLADRQLTAKGLDVIAAIERYKFLPSSLLVRLVEGGQRNNYRHLQTLFHKSLVNRFALPTTYGTPGEFIYYLDSKQALQLLIDRGLMTEASEEERKRKEETIRLNREKGYSRLHVDPDMHGKLLYIQHELMVSRFHAMLELGCRKFAGKLELEQWRQGPELWQRVDVPGIKQDRQSGTWEEMEETESLPHRPDAFFTLRFLGKPEGQQCSHFFYEADRGTENTTRFRMKLRAHYHFVVKQNRHRNAEPYNVHAIRAVLTESTSANWAQNLREAAKHPIVSARPSPLFWFTTSEILTKPVPAAGKTLPLYLQEPECVFKRIWASPADDKFLNLAD